MIAKEPHERSGMTRGCGSVEESTGEVGCCKAQCIMKEGKEPSYRLCQIRHIIGVGKRGNWCTENVMENLVRDASNRRLPPCLEPRIM